MTLFSWRNSPAALFMATVSIYLSMLTASIASPFDPRSSVDTDDETALAERLASISEQGTLLYKKDSAAALASDGLNAALDGFDSRVRGWITENQGDDRWRVVFFGDGDAMLHWVEIDSDAIIPGGVKSFGTGVPLNNRQRAMVSARKAAAGKKFSACADAYNTIVVDAPDGDFFVYLIGASQDPSSVIIGGHYRRLVDGDSFKVKQTSRFSKGCLTLQKGKNSAALISSNTYVTHPEEVHVFVSLLYNLPLYIITSKNKKFWKIENGEVSLVRGN